ncbi:MAG TPA: XRE family transcriptional regulator [Prolixibacteraceae bacterium]|nr:XRE family transcriptional regulator [Prolixibacteraceae bacterium]
MKEKVKRLCKEQGKSLNDLATEMKIARESLTRALNGNPTLKTIQNIANHLGVETWELFTDSLPVGSPGDVHGVIYLGGRPNLINSMKELENLSNLSKLGQS